MREMSLYNYMSKHCRGLIKVAQVSLCPMMLPDQIGCLIILCYFSLMVKIDI